MKPPLCGTWTEGHPRHSKHNETSGGRTMLKPTRGNWGGIYANIVAKASQELISSPSLERKSFGEEQISGRGKPLISYSCYFSQFYLLIMMS